MAGVTVTFAATRGGGSVAGGTVVTEASGVATVGAWTLGAAVSENVLSATSGTLGAVIFTANSTAGAAASLAANGGDNQSAAPGASVPVPPSVVVRDAGGNPKSGVGVTFAVMSGGGSITGAAAVTNGAGVATVGSWTLGNAGGLNSLSAAVTGLPAVVFTARTISNPCTVRATHTFGTTSGGTLSTDDCQLPDGSHIDFHTTSIPQAGAYFFRQSAGFETYLFLMGPDGTTIGENDVDPDTGINSVVKALLPAGSYVLGPSSFAAGMTGDYSISSTTAPTDVGNCEVVFIVKNVTTSQAIQTTDCNLSDSGAPVYSDAFFLFLNAGTSVTIDMSSATIDAYLQLVRLDGLVVAENDNVDATTNNARITFTATQTAYYGIFARSVPGTAVGGYALSVQ